MGWPISALGDAVFRGWTFVFILVLAGRPGPNKKPTTASSRGFLSKFALEATSFHGASAYDGGDACENDLQRI
jgi:hypothetical protein